jgi:AAT family amino acid transporter
VLTLLGAVAMLAILVTTYFTNVFQMTLVFGVPFLLILAVLYAVLFKKRGEAVVLQARQQRG